MQVWTRAHGTVVRKTAMKTILRPAFLAAFTLCLCSCSRVQTPQRPMAGSAPYEGSAGISGKFVWPAGKRAAVSLTFDDARPSQLDVGMPVFEGHGIKVTFYVSTPNVEKRLPEWKDVATAGHEIGNHSMLHPCTGNFPWSRQKALEDYTLARMAAELDEANAEIEQLLGVRAVTFAYPCGQKFVGRGKDTRSYVPIVASRFLAGRGWRDEGANDPAFCDLAQLMTMELDGLTFEQLKTVVDQAAEKGFWLVLCGHDIGAGGRQTVPVDTLRAFCEYARDPRSGLWVDTVANVGRYVVEQRAAGHQNRRSARHGDGRMLVSSR